MKTLMALMLLSTSMVTSMAPAALADRVSDKPTEKPVEKNADKNVAKPASAPALQADKATAEKKAGDKPASEKTGDKNADASAPKVPAEAENIPISHDPSLVQDGSFVLDPVHTQVEFGVSYMGFATYYGRASEASGKLELSVKDPATSTLSVVLPTASVSTISTKLNEELRSAEWLDAQKFPQITFQSTKIVSTGKSTADVAGNLQLHGATKPVTLHVYFVGAGTNPVTHKYTVGFQGVALIKRSEFGISTQLPLIGDEVQLTLSGAFERDH